MKQQRTWVCADTRRYIPYGSYNFRVKPKLDKSLKIKQNLYASFWVIPQRLNFICWCFRTLCLFHLHRQVGMKNDCGWECCSICMGKGLARAKPFPLQILRHSQPQSSFIPTHLWRWNRKCSETSAYKIQTPGNYPEENIQHSEHGKSLKSRKQNLFLAFSIDIRCPSSKTKDKQHYEDVTKHHVFANCKYYHYCDIDPPPAQTLLLVPQPDYSHCQHLSASCDLLPSFVSASVPAILHLSPADLQHFPNLSFLMTNILVNLYLPGFVFKF